MNWMKVRHCWRVGTPSRHLFWYVPSCGRLGWDGQMDGTIGSVLLHELDTCWQYRTSVWPCLLDESNDRGGLVWLVSSVVTWPIPTPLTRNQDFLVVVPSRELRLPCCCIVVHPPVPVQVVQDVVKALQSKVNLNPVVEGSVIKAPLPK